MLRRYAALCAIVLSLGFCATAAQSAVLWDQSNFSLTNEGSVDLSSNSCSQISGNTKVHLANDVTFTGPVTITNVRIYETAGNVQAATQAYLWIAPKTGPMPTINSLSLEAAALLKPITITSETHGSTTAVVVSCNNLNIALPAGDYWVSLTPKHSLGLFPYTVHLVTTGPVVGDPTSGVLACTDNTAWYIPLAPTNYDYAMKIEGDQPVPAVGTSWGAIKSIYR